MSQRTGQEGAASTRTPLLSGDDSSSASPIVNRSSEESHSIEMQRFMGTSTPHQHNGGSQTSDKDGLLLPVSTETDTTDCGAIGTTIGSPRVSTPASSVNLAVTDRMCFICLEGPEGECGELVPCCDRCYAHVHRGCWAEWRQNQRMTALRSRLTGLRPAGTDPFLCSICKTGQACVEGESHDVAWLAAVTGSRSSRGRQSPWEVLGSFGARSDASSDSDEDDDLFADSEGVEDSPVCSPWLAAINFAALMVFAILTPLGINLGWGSAGDVILVGFVGLYQFYAIEAVIVAIAHRRYVQRMRMRRRGTMEDTPSADLQPPVITPTNADLEAADPRRARLLQVGSE